MRVEDLAFRVEGLGFRAELRVYADALSNLGSTRHKRQVPFANPN